MDGWMDGWMDGDLFIKLNDKNKNLKTYIGLLRF